MLCLPIALKEKVMEYRLIFRNTLSKEVYVFTLADSGTGRFYVFPLPVGLENGEYEYYVAEAGGTLGLYTNEVRKSTVDGHRIQIFDCGVARVGQIARTGTVEYNTAKTYEQYR